MSARDAVTTAEQYASMLLAKEQNIAREFSGFTAMRDMFITSALDADPAPLDDSDALKPAARYAAQYGTQGQRMFDEIRFTAQEAAQRRLWQQSRIVYDIHPDLWTELGDTNTDAVIPTDLWSRLPHPDPFVALPEPLILPLDEDTQQRILGFFVRGQADVPADDDFIQCSTAHPSVTSLGITVGGLVETRTGKPVYAGPAFRDVVWTRVTLDPRVGEHTVAEMIDHTVGRFTGYRTGGADDIPRMIRRAVSLLVYLCATNADLTPLPKQTAAGTGKKAKGQGKAKPSHPIGVGYRIGAALAAYRKREREQATLPTGRHTAPHIRRAHFHTYWVGPRGQQTAEVRWLSPIPVNMHGEPEHTTVIPVPQRAATDGGHQ